jgi:hypothetical protein
LLQLAGLAVLCVSVWLLADPTSYVKAIQDESSYYLAMYVLLGAGALMFIVGFLGCSGAYKESQCMLVSVSIAYIKNITKINFKNKNHYHSMILY